MQPTFTRGFRLHHNGQVLDGAQFPSGRVLVVDDPEYGLATIATSMEELLKGYHGARVEWPTTDRADGTPTTTPEMPPCDGCGHPEHPPRKCPVTRNGERCDCDEPIAPEAGQDGARE